MNVAIVGCGDVGLALARGALTAGCSIAGCVEPNRERARAFCETFGVTASGWQGLLKSPPDALAIASPTKTHGAYIADAAAAKIPLVVSRPLCLSSVEYRRIDASVRKYGSPIALADADPHHSAVASMKAQYDAGKAGTAGFVRVLRRAAPPDHANDWRRKKDTGGVVLNEMTPDFEMLLELYGPPQRVFAQVVRKSGRGFFEYALVTLSFSTGLIAQLVGSWAQPGGGRTTMEICGDGGMIQYDSADDAMEYTPRGTGRDDRSPTNSISAPWRALNAPSDMEALRRAGQAVALAETVLKSAETGKAVAFRPGRRSA